MVEGKPKACRKQPKTMLRWGSGPKCIYALGKVAMRKYKYLPLTIVICRLAAASIAFVVMPEVIPLQAKTTLWAHNGSLVELVHDGKLRNFYYNEPATYWFRLGYDPELFCLVVHQQGHATSELHTFSILDVAEDHTMSADQFWIIINGSFFKVVPLG
jgi:hypothetical protein